MKSSCTVLHYLFNIIQLLITPSKQESKLKQEMTLAFSVLNCNIVVTYFLTIWNKDIKN